jgi:Mg-chelatase subunit ChlD
MTPTIKQSDWFTSTSDKPYDRHTYKIILSDGRYKDFDDYEYMRAYWMQTTQIYGLQSVEVLDLKQQKKGFK